MTTDDPVRELGPEECWGLLERHEFARLAYRLVDEVHIVPLNYVVDAGTLLIRTGSGNKLLAAALSSEVALEIDWHDGLTAWSVVARGRLRRLEERERHRLDGHARQPWLDTPKDDVVELVPSVVTGRRFRLSRS